MKPHGSQRNQTPSVGNLDHTTFSPPASQSFLLKISRCHCHALLTGKKELRIQLYTIGKREIYRNVYDWQKLLEEI